MQPRSFAVSVENKPLIARLKSLNWVMISLVVVVACAGLAMLYSVAGGNIDPWASRQGIRFLFGLVLMLGIAVTNIRFWMAVAYPAWFAGLALLIGVEFIGATGMGGQRWLDLGFMRLQPSELMKVAVVMALARYYHSRTRQQSRAIIGLIIPAILIFVPVYFIVRQPDLGTGLMIVIGGAGILFMAGASIWLFITAGIAVSAAIPVGWQFMRDYQKNRVLTFLNPESDPLGAGYQITQSKIALGSGGTWGKGFLEGTQSQLNFLPEMKTDFIFTVLAEEFGLAGGLILLGLYGILLLFGILSALGCRSQFGRLLSAGLSITLFLYLFINVGMVMGLMPVVGVPLPLLSYGGSAMLTFMVAYGLILSAAAFRHVTLAPKGSGLA